MEINLVQENDSIPQWLLRYINPTCGCGAPLVVNENLTRMWCINPYCKFHTAKRVEWLANEFKITGYGPANSLDLVERNHIQCHLEVLPVWFREKPTVELWEVGKYSMLYGLKGKWEDMLHGCRNFTEYFARNDVPIEIQKSRDYLLYCETFFNVKIPNYTAHTIYVWLTGSFNGYVNRNDFLAELNAMYGDVVQVKDNKHKKSGTQYLIKPATAADRSKTSDALAMGIPIITPEQFSEIIARIYYGLKIS